MQQGFPVTFIFYEKFYRAETSIVCNAVNSAYSSDGGFEFFDNLFIRDVLIESAVFIFKSAPVVNVDMQTPIEISVKVEICPVCKFIRHCAGVFVYLHIV